MAGFYPGGGNSILRLPSGKALIGGNYSTYNGTPAWSLVRIFASPANFNPGALYLLLEELAAGGSDSRESQRSNLSGKKGEWSESPFLLVPRATAGEWLVEKTGFNSPGQARAQWLAQASLARAA